MSTVLKNHVVDLIQQTSHINKDIEKTAKVNIATLEDTAEKYSSKSSQYLAAIVGGGIGLSGGFGVSLMGVSMVFTGPIGLVLGAAAAILIWRGRGQQKIERANQKVQAVKNRILEDINSLPPSAPQYVVDRLWELYNNATDVYERSVVEALLDGTSKFDIIHDLKKMPIANIRIANSGV
jgi:hypothetical protein